jgi:choline dehydrogenase
MARRARGYGVHELDSAEISRRFSSATASGMVGHVMADYIIVGAGSAGAVLANRLSEDRSTNVVLLEAGPASNDLRIKAPGLYQFLWRSKLDWEFYTEPQEHVDGRRMFWPRGKVVGGTSALNAMVYIRGHRSNYDEWRDLGNPGWGYDDVLPYFKRSEGFRGPASPYHGTSGPLVVSRAARVSDVSNAFIEAFSTHMGLAKTDDFNGAEQAGVGQFHHTVCDGVRACTRVAFLDPAKERKNLRVISDAHVLGLTLDGTRVDGVRYEKNGRVEVEHAAREVILAAGAIGSPHLLLLSGIGPADQLRRLGIPVVLDLPGVGENLQDHLLTVVQHETLERGSESISIPGLLYWIARYAATKGGPLSNSPVDVGAFMKLDSSEPRPNLQFHFAPFGVDAPNTDEKRDPPLGRFFGMYPSLIYPKSRGTIRLRTSDPKRAPAIDPRYFSDPADLDTLVRGVKIARDVANSAPLSRYRGKEIFPGESATSDDAIIANIKNRANTIFHPVGTCKMGVDELAVVDPELRVRGLHGLRVVDASIMPTIVGGNTNAPVIMIAEKAADMIRAATP